MPYQQKTYETLGTRDPPTQTTPHDFYSLFICSFFFCMYSLALPTYPNTIPVSILFNLLNARNCYYSVAITHTSVVFLTSQQKKRSVSCFSLLLPLPFVVFCIYVCSCVRVRKGFCECATHQLEARLQETFRNNSADDCLTYSRNDRENERCEKRK